jgi:vacuolar protein sorting-associated protein VTA1
VASKSKYAKYHALRIAKALKAGEDPNLSNPAPETVTTPPPLDPNDPEVRSLQPTVEDLNETSSFQGDQGGLPAVSTRSPPPQHFSQPQSGGDVSPLEPEQPGDGYFPQIPTFTAPTDAPSLPTAPADEDMTDPPHSAPDPQDYYKSNPSPQSIPSPPSAPPQQPIQPPSVTSQARSFQPSAPAPAPAPVQAQQGQGTYINTDEAILAAQKHAKWAISALNFEDVDTAVDELRIALQALGAR